MEIKETAIKLFYNVRYNKYPGQGR